MFFFSCFSSIFNMLHYRNSTRRFRLLLLLLNSLVRRLTILKRSRCRRCSNGSKKTNHSWYTWSAQPIVTNAVFSGCCRGWTWYCSNIRSGALYIKLLPLPLPALGLGLCNTWNPTYQQAKIALNARLSPAYVILPRQSWQQQETTRTKKNLMPN